MFAKHLKKAMKAHGFTQKQAGVMAKSSQSTVSNIMNGVKPTLNFLNNFYRSFSDTYGDEALEKHFKLRSVVKPHLLTETQVLDLLKSFNSPKAELVRLINQHTDDLSDTAVSELIDLIINDLNKT